MPYVADRVWRTPVPGYELRTMNTMSPSVVSLHHRREHQERAGVDGGSDRYQNGKNGRGDHQNAAQRLGVLVHPDRLPGTGWPLTNALVNARSAHG